MDYFKFIKLPVKKPWLYFTAGAVWFSVGLLLNKYAYLWLINFELFQTIFLIIIGISLALIISKFGFIKLAQKNIRRIENIKSFTPSLFTFQEWASYPLVVVMISMGIYLRKYSTFPESLLSVFYLAMGSSLFLASFQYFRKLSNKDKIENTVNN